MTHFWSQVEYKIVRFTYEVSLFDLYAYLIRESLKRQNILSIFRIFAIPNKTISSMRKIRNCMKKKLTFVGEKKQTLSCVRGKPLSCVKKI